MGSSASSFESSEAEAEKAETLPPVFVTNSFMSQFSSARPCDASPVLSFARSHRPATERRAEKEASCDDVSSYQQENAQSVLPDSPLQFTSHTMPEFTFPKCEYEDEESTEEGPSMLAADMYEGDSELKFDSRNDQSYEKVQLEIEEDITKELVDTATAVTTETLERIAQRVPKYVTTKRVCNCGKKNSAHITAVICIGSL